MPALLAETEKEIKKGYHHFVFSMNAELHSLYKCK